MTAHQPGDGGDDGTDGGEQPPEEVRELLESIDEAEDVDGATADADDDEESMDPRVERFGWYAGGVITVLLGLMLFVGPWRLIEITFEGGAIPFALRDSTEMNIMYVAPVVFVLVGAVSGAIYRATTTDVPDDYRFDMSMMVVVVQILAAIALFVLVMLVPVGESLLAGDVVEAVLLVVISAVYLLFFTFFEMIGITLYVGIPTYVGVFAGGLLGRVAP